MRSCGAPFRPFLAATAAAKSGGARTAYKICAKASCFRGKAVS